MKRGFVLRRVAEKEFDDSIAWYENERGGLGQEFRTAIEEYFQRIADNPCMTRALGAVRPAPLRVSGARKCQW